MLLDAGADVNGTCSVGDTPLLVAVQNDKITCVKKLIEAGADVNVASKDGETPLLYAARHGKTQSLKALLSTGADIEKADDKGFTPFFASFLGDSNRECRRVLLKAGANVNCKTKKGTFPLIAAIGDVQDLHFILDNGADVNMKTDKGLTALIRAAYHGYTEAVKVLLKAGADVNITNLAESSALTYAVDDGHSDIVNLLLDAGADVNIDTASAAIFCKDQTTFHLIYKARYDERPTDDTEREAIPQRYDILGETSSTSGKW